LKAPKQSSRKTIRRGNRIFP